MTKRKANIIKPPLLYVHKVLAWADNFHRRQGCWPTAYSGRILGAAGDTWRRVDSALRLGLRGLPSGSSLAQLLAKQRGVRNQKTLPRLTYKQRKGQAFQRSVVSS